MYDYLKFFHVIFQVVFTNFVANAASMEIVANEIKADVGNISRYEITEITREEFDTLYEKYRVYYEFGEENISTESK